MATWAAALSEEALRLVFHWQALADGSGDLAAKSREELVEWLSGVGPA